MKTSKILATVAAGVFAVAAMAVAASADIVVTPEDTSALTKVSDGSAVKFAIASYDGIAGGEDNGAWLLGGDNGDIGISIAELAKYDSIDVAYTCDNPIDGVQIGLAFKVHIDMESRTCPDGGYVFYDYLPATWVPYGAGAFGEQIGETANALETIYQTQVEADGVISIPVSKLLDVFPNDSDYLMGIGFGANNNGDGIAQDAIDNEEEYTLDCTSITLVGTPAADAPIVEEEAPAAEDGAAVVADTAAPTTGDKASPETGVADVAVVAGIALIAAGAVIVSKKSK